MIEKNKYYRKDKCIYEQIPLFYALLNADLVEECSWCPFDTDCKVCSGLNDILMSICYNCNKCKQWGE